MFHAQPLCSSTRSHLKSQVMLLISGICVLHKPLLSVPISTCARQRKSAQTPLVSERQHWRYKKLNYVPPNLSSIPPVPQYCVQPISSACAIRGKNPPIPTFKLLAEIDSVQVANAGYLPAAVIAHARASNVSLPTSTLLSSTTVVYSSSFCFISTYLRKGPIVMLGIFYTKYIQIFTDLVSQLDVATTILTPISGPSHKFFFLIPHR